MPFPFALLRIILLSLIVISNIISLVLSAIAVHEKTGGVSQGLAICFDILSLLTVTGYLCHQWMNHGKETSNTRNLAAFGICGLLGTVLATSLTVHATQASGMAICNDFAHAGRPCVPAGAQLGVAYVVPIFAVLGFIVSWMDKYPGAVEVTPRYPITKAPSSHFAAYGHDLDENYTPPPVKTSSRSRNNSQWTDVPLDC